MDTHVNIIGLESHQRLLLEEDLQASRRIVEKEKENTSYILGNNAFMAVFLLFVGGTISPLLHPASKTLIIISVGFLLFILILGNWAYLVVYCRHEKELQVHEILRHTYDCKEITVEEQMKHLATLNEFQMLSHKLETIEEGAKTCASGKMTNVMLRTTVAVSVSVFLGGFALAVFGH